MDNLFIMRNLFLTIVLLAFLRLDAQIVFSEIMYNDPGYGLDSLEFVELYNYTDEPIDLTNYQFTDGITFTFPPYTLESESYVVVCKFASTLKRVFELSDDNLFAWSDTGSVSLNNDGEILQFSDAQGNVIDEIEYFPTADWHQAQVNGFGYSLQFCDYSLDNNNGSNWSASNQVGDFQYTGNDPFITGVLTTFDVYATPKSGCFATSDIFKQNQPSLFYPNPFKNYLTIPQSSKVYSISGQLLIENKQKSDVDTSDWPSGVYFLKVENSIYKMVKI